MTTSFLMSALAGRFRASTFEAFGAQFPGPWLVWEPGNWKPPTVGGQTLVAPRAPTPPPMAGEALALLLAPRQPQGTQVLLGRGTENDLQINDGTLSQLHLVLMVGDQGAWTVRDAGSKNGSWLNGIPLRAGAPHPLRDGAQIQAAQVCLTFHDAAGLWRRLQAWTGTPKTPAPVSVARTV